MDDPFKSFLKKYEEINAETRSCPRTRNLCIILTVVFGGPIALAKLNAPEEAYLLTGILVVVVCVLWTVMSHGNKEKQS